MGKKIWGQRLFGLLWIDTKTIHLIWIDWVKIYQFLILLYPDIHFNIKPVRQPMLGYPWMGKKNFEGSANLEKSYYWHCGFKRETMKWIQIQSSYQPTVSIYYIPFTLFSAQKTKSGSNSRYKCDGTSLGSSHWNSQYKIGIWKQDITVILRAFTVECIRNSLCSRFRKLRW